MQVQMHQELFCSCILLILLEGVIYRKPLASTFMKRVYRSLLLQAMRDRTTVESSSNPSPFLTNALQLYRLFHQREGDDGAVICETSSDCCCNRSSSARRACFS